jgi:multiple sugar transport system substrate-binding protein
MKTTRTLTLALVLLCAAAALWAAGSGESAAAGGPASITYTQFSGSGDNLKYLNMMLEEFQKLNPNVKVTIETVGYGEYFTQLQTRVAAGTAPDAYELNYENFVTYAKKGVLMDMNPLFSAARFDKKTLDANALSAFNADGKQYGLPASFSDVLLFYNKDLFDKATVAYPTDAWTWKDELAAAQKIRALDDKTFGVFQPIQFWELYKMVQQNGGSILNADKSKFTLNTKQNVETLTFMVDRIRKYNVMPTDAQLSGMGDWDLFKSGRLGMIVTGIWAFPDFIRDCKFNWDVAVEPGNAKKATHFFANGIVLNKDGKNAAAAFSWVRFMSASKEAAKIRVDAGWELPASTYPDVLDAYLKATPPANRKAVFDSLKYLVTPPVIEQFTQMTDLIGVHLQAARDGVKSPEQALNDAQKELEEKIKL